MLFKYTVIYSRTLENNFFLLLMYLVLEKNNELRAEDEAAEFLWLNESTQILR